MANFENDTQDIYRGDIYFITSWSAVGSDTKAGRPGIVVSNDIANRHSPNVQIVPLTSQDKKPLPVHVEVLCKTPSTALCENLQTIPKERLGNFMRSCTTKEMANIDRALLCSLGIEAPVPRDTNVETERNLYKTLYEQLLDRITAKV